MEVKKEDNYLIDRFLSGDEQGFELLVKKYQDQVLNIVYSLVGQSDHIEDIAQEVFIKVYKNLSSFKKKADFATWLYRITVNTAYNYLKKEKRRYASLEILKKETDLFPKVSRADLSDQEKYRLIIEAISKLPFKYRTVIVLNDIEGFSYKDIAQILGCRLGTVESRLFKARSLLREMLSSLL
jgi:RNA polymerase sigma-70 factor (ECF subfamily)